MHVSPAVLHLHLFAQVGSALQPNLISSLLTYRCRRMTTKRQTAKYIDGALNEGTTTVIVRTRCGCHFGWNLSRSCQAPSSNAVIGILWRREALPLLVHQLNLPRTWIGKSSCFAILHALSDSDATSHFSVKRQKVNLDSGENISGNHCWVHQRVSGSAAFRLNLCKLDNHPTERSGSINKRVFENILKCH